MGRTSSGPVLVTGGTGFVGSHLVELLISRGYEVACLARDPDRLRWIAGLPVRVVQGDCSRPGSLPAAVRDAAVVYHVAGLTKAFRSRDYYEVNQQGTRNLLEACARHAPGLRNFVLVSSQAAAGPSLDGRPIQENDAPHPVTDYGRSKLLAEEEALRYKDRFPVVILRPSAVYGPRDTDVLELFKMASKGIILDLAGGERFMNWCFVRDLAETLLAAGERPVPTGSRYFVAEERSYSATEFHDALLRTGCVRARVIRLPIAMGYAVGLLSEAAGALRGKATIMNRQKVREAVQRAWTCDVSRTRNELGFTSQTGLEDGLTATWKWYRDASWVR